MLVVLPTPFTPTVSTTRGPPPFEGESAGAALPAGDSASTISPFSASITSDTSRAPRAAARVLSISCAAAATPTSAEMSISSSSSHVSSSTRERSAICVTREYHDSRLLLRPRCNFSRLPNSLLNMGES